ncbi:hypothetical protein R75465_05485 [Paraburkholderia aspalathi]|nr:hypothetical protein R75465_05485 [Paraburkholderia aspalathi]
MPAAKLMAPALDPLWNAVGIDHTQTNFAGGRMAGRLCFRALLAMPCLASHQARKPQAGLRRRSARGPLVASVAARRKRPEVAR